MSPEPSEGPVEADLVEADLIEADLVDWVPVGTVAEITRRKKLVAEIAGRQVLVIVDGGQFFALDNICSHRDRELSKGVILNGKIVCPGHQWAFALDSGWESVKQVCQPTFPTRIVDDTVEVGVGPTTDPSDAPIVGTTAAPVEAQT